jgi:homoserine kinase
MSRIVSVSVPATSANLGPGYDALGLALEIRDFVTAQFTAEAAKASTRLRVCATASMVAGATTTFAS